MGTENDDAQSLKLPANVEALACILCGERTTDPWKWECDACGPESRMDVVYQPDAPQKLAAALGARPFDMWRYREVLPLPDMAWTGGHLPPVAVGGSPICEAPRLANDLGVARVVLKDDGRNPSGSLKDRPSFLAAAFAHAAGKDAIACASTGNAASSTACAAASLGLPAFIFVPARAPEPKVAQLRIFGATVFRVAADYDTTWELCAEVAKDQPWFNRNCAVNPYLVEGKKTAALELAEQLGPKMTDWVSYSVGDGCTIASAIKGFEEAHRAGIIPFVPRLLGVQAQGAQPLVLAAAENRPFVPGPAETMADSIAVGHPRNGRKALDFMARNDGRWVAVTDAAIQDAMRKGARLGGVFGEPAAAAAVAGVRTAVEAGIIEKNQSVSVLVSGNGLKDTKAALEAAGGPIDVAPNVGSVLEALQRA